VLLSESHGQPIGAVAALVMYAAGKTAHQMDADIAYLCLVKRSGNGWRRDLGRIECAAVILDPGDQRLVLTLDFDCNFQATVRDAAR